MKDSSVLIKGLIKINAAFTYEALLVQMQVFIRLSKPMYLTDLLLGCTFSQGAVCVDEELVRKCKELWTDIH